MNVISFKGELLVTPNNPLLAIVREFAYVRLSWLRPWKLLEKSSWGGGGGRCSNTQSTPLATPLELACVLHWYSIPGINVMALKWAEMHKAVVWQLTSKISYKNCKNLLMGVPNHCDSAKTVFTMHERILHSHEMVTSRSKLTLQPQDG